MRRPCADREEKRVLHGRDIKQEEEEQLDSRNPNQRRLLDKEVAPKADALPGDQR
jgi:hypothetical protein